METGSNCLGPHRLPSTCLTTKHKVPHRLAGLCRYLGVLADTNNLLGNDVPIGETRHHALFAGAERPLRELIVTRKVPRFVSYSTLANTGSCLNDLELAIDNTSRSVSTCVNCQPGKRWNIPCGWNRQINAGFANALCIFNAAIDIITKQQSCFKGIIHLSPSGIHQFPEMCKVSTELVIFLQYWHQAEQECRSRPRTCTHGIWGRSI